MELGSLLLGVEETCRFVGHCMAQKEFIHNKRISKMEIRVIEYISNGAKGTEFFVFMFAGV
jgi:hypothetical protein